MKITTFGRTFALALPLLSASLGLVHVASAQPKVGRAGRGHRAKSGLSPRLLAAIEAKMGHPLSSDQKLQLDAAGTAHRTAMKAATGQLQSDIARITGLSPADVKSLGHKPRAPKTITPKA